MPLLLWLHQRSVLPSEQWAGELEQREQCALYWPRRLFSGVKMISRGLVHIKASTGRCDVKHLVLEGSSLSTERDQTHNSYTSSTFIFYGYSIAQATFT